jgi:hypothetical protein
MNEFKYGDMVEVRDYLTDKWEGPVFYLGSIPLPNGSVRHYTMRSGQDESNFNESTVIWYHVRKLTPEPEPQQTIEERLERLEKAILKTNGELDDRLNVLESKIEQPTNPKNNN